MGSTSIRVLGIDLGTTNSTVAEVIIETDFEVKVEAEFNKMIERITDGN